MTKTQPESAWSEQTQCQLCACGPLEEFVVPEQTRFDFCPRCGLYQNGPLHDMSMYELECYHACYQHHESRKLMTAAVRLNRVASCIPSRRQLVRFLDIGCGMGTTLKAGAARGWDVVGVDVSKRAVEHCRGQGLTAQATDGYSLPFPDGHFDAATAWSVVEHVPDIRAALAEWHRVLRPGGVLALDTSNAKCLKARLRGARYRSFWAVGHTYTFTPTNLGMFLARAGFTLMQPPLVGRWSDLTFPVACYALGYQTLYSIRSALRFQKPFQLFARRCDSHGSALRRAG